MDAKGTPVGKGRTSKCKWMGLVLAIIVAACLPAQAIAAARDVPRDHWAYEAVERLHERGYLTLYDDGTFRGENPVDRFTFAAVIYQLLREIEAGLTSVDPADVALLRQVATEFRDELVAFHQLRSELIASVEDAEERIGVFDETLTRVIDRVVAVETDTKQLREEMARETERLYLALAEEAARLRTEQEAARDELTAQVRGLEEGLAHQREELLAEIDRLNTTFGTILEEEGADFARRLEEASRVLSGNLTDLQARLQDVQDRLAEVEAALFLLDERMARENGELRGSLDQLWEESDQLLATSEALLADVESLYQSVSELEQRLAATREELQAQGNALMGGHGQLMSDLDALRQRVRDLEVGQSRTAAQMAGMQEEMSVLGQQLGLTAEEREQLLARVKDELQAQLNLSLMREQRLQRELQELRAEFDSYRASKDEEVSGLRSTATIAVAVGVIGLILGLSN